MISNQGDTFELLSRRAYGTPTNADLLKQANPGLIEPLPAGVEVVTPQSPNTPANRSQSNSEDGFTLVLDGGKFVYWNEVAVTRTIDSPPSVEIATVWEPKHEELRRAFKPFSFVPTEVYIGKDKLFTGTMLTPTPQCRRDESTLTASAYGRTGALLDCTSPGSAFGLDFNDQKLDQIAAKILQPFGVTAVFQSPPGEVFEQFSVNPSDRVLPLLAKLAKQRGLIISETPDGDLLFTTGEPPARPSAVLSDQASPVEEVRAAFSPQEYYSHITVIAPTLVGLLGEQVTARNPHLTQPLRPYVFEAEDSQNQTLQQIADTKLGRMFANMVSWQCRVVGWRKEDGALWTPGETIKLHAPTAMIYKPTILLVRGVTLEQTDDSQTATLELILPTAFAGRIPESMPWDE